MASTTLTKKTPEAPIHAETLTAHAMIMYNKLQYTLSDKPLGTKCTFPFEPYEDFEPTIPDDYGIYPEMIGDFMELLIKNRRYIFTVNEKEIVVSCYTPAHHVFPGAAIVHGPTFVLDEVKRVFKEPLTKATCMTVGVIGYLGDIASYKYCILGGTLSWFLKQLWTIPLIDFEVKGRTIQIVSRLPESIVAVSQNITVNGDESRDTVISLDKSVSSETTTSTTSHDGFKDNLIFHSVEWFFVNAIVKLYSSDALEYVTYSDHWFTSSGQPAFTFETYTRVLFMFSNYGFRSIVSDVVSVDKYRLTVKRMDLSLPNVAVQQLVSNIVRSVDAIGEQITSVHPDSTNNTLRYINLPQVIKQLTVKSIDVEACYNGSAVLPVKLRLKHKK